MVGVEPTSSGIYTSRRSPVELQLHSAGFHSAGFHSACFHSSVLPFLLCLHMYASIVGDEAAGVRAPLL